MSTLKAKLDDLCMSLGQQRDEHTDYISKYINKILREIRKRLNSDLEKKTVKDVDGAAFLEMKGIISRASGILDIINSCAHQNIDVESPSSPKKNVSDINEHCTNVSSTGRKPCEAPSDGTDRHRSIDPPSVVHSSHDGPSTATYPPLAADANLVPVEQPVEVQTTNIVNVTDYNESYGDTDHGHTVTEFPPMNLGNKEAVRVFMLHIENPFKFLIQSEDFFQFCDIINHYVRNNRKCITRPVLVNSPCLVFSSENNSYVRGKIENIVSEDRCNVFLVDCAVTVKACMHELLYIPPAFIREPIQSCYVTLAKVIPPPGTIYWSDKVNRIMKSYAEGPLLCQLVSQGHSPRPLVELSKYTEAGPGLSAYLVEKSFAQKVDISDQVTFMWNMIDRDSVAEPYISHSFRAIQSNTESENVDAPVSSGYYTQTSSSIDDHPRQPSLGYYERMIALPDDCSRKTTFDQTRSHYRDKSVLRHDSVCPLRTGLTPSPVEEQTSTLTTLPSPPSTSCTVIPACSPIIPFTDGKVELMEKFFKSSHLGNRNISSKTNSMQSNCHDSFQSNDFSASEYRSSHRSDNFPEFTNHPSEFVKLSDNDDLSTEIESITNQNASQPRTRDLIRPLAQKPIAAKFDHKQFPYEPDINIPKTDFSKQNREPASLSISTNTDVVFPRSIFDDSQKESVLSQSNKLHMTNGEGLTKYSQLHDNSDIQSQRSKRHRSLSDHNPQLLNHSELTGKLQSPHFNRADNFEKIISDLEKFLHREPIHVLMSHIVSPGEFYIHPVYFGSTGGNLDRIAERIEAYIDESRSSNDHILSNPSTNDICLCKYSGDGLYYRAQVKEAAAFSAEVFFIDYGNSESVSIEYIIKIPEDLLQYNWQATCCKLAFLSPLDNEATWSEESCNYLQEICSVTENNDGVYMYVVSDGYESDALLSVPVVLINTSVDNDGDICINSLMVKSNSAQFVQPESDWLQIDKRGSPNPEENLDPLHDWNPILSEFISSRNSYSLNVNDASIASTGVNVRYKKVCPNIRIYNKCPDESKCRFSHSRNVEETYPSKAVYNDLFAKTVLPHKNSNVSVEVFTVYNPGCFYIGFPYGSRGDQSGNDSGKPQPLIELVKEMTLYYNSQPKCDSDITEFAQGSVVAVSESDHSWYRARISETLHEKSQLNVFYIDFGRQLNVSVTDVREILPDFLHLPAQAVRCELFGIRPLPLGKDWSYGASNFLYNLTKGRQLIAHVLDAQDLPLPIDLIDTTGTTQLSIAESLVNNQYAEFTSSDNDN